MNDEAPALSVPVLEPVPVPACRICEAVGKQREAARRLKSWVSVANANEEIRRHPHRCSPRDHGTAA